MVATMNLYVNTRLYDNADTTEQTKSGKLYSRLVKHFTHKAPRNTIFISGKLMKYVIGET